MIHKTPTKKIDIIIKNRSTLDLIATKIANLNNNLVVIIVLSSIMML